MKKTVLVGALLMAGVASAGSPQWDYASLGYASVEGGDYTGFALQGSKRFGDHFFGRLDYLSTSGDFDSLNPDLEVIQITVDYDTTSLSAGYIWPVNDHMDAYGLVGYTHLSGAADLDWYGNISDSASGYTLGAGIRSMLTDQVDLGAEIAYFNSTNYDTTVFNVYGRYFITEQWAAEAKYFKDDYEDGFIIGGSYFF